MSEEKGYPEAEEKAAGADAIDKFVTTYARRVVSAEDVYKVAGKDHTKAHSAFRKKGYKILTHREYPDFLAKEQMLLWPADEILPENDHSRSKFSDFGIFVGKDLNEDSLEWRRRIISRQTPKKIKAKFGQFFTNEPTARFMSRLFEDKQLSVIKLLDAGAGIGILSDAFFNVHNNTGAKIVITACEIDTRLKDELKTTLDGKDFRIVWGDFVENAVNWLQFQPQERFSHAILNPPYKKISSNSVTRKLLRHVGIETVNMYSAFVALGLMLLEPKGQLVAIVPRSFCNGPYYKPFRKLVLGGYSINHIHLFDSRTAAFKDDGVLQENVIINISKESQRKEVTISLSSNDLFEDYSEIKYLFSRIVFPDDPELFIHVPSEEGQDRLELMRDVNQTLKDIDINVSTGPVVAYRFKDFIRDEHIESCVPLIYPEHCITGSIIWPKSDGKKAGYLLRNEVTEKSLFPKGFYCLVKRFSAKEERRRIVASVVGPRDLGDATMLAFENHLNVFHFNRQGGDESLVKGLAAYLNTTIVDQYFRRFNGHTQVNATDLRQLPYPSREKIREIGMVIKDGAIMEQEHIDTIVSEVLS